MPKPEAFSRVLIDQELRESGWDLLDERPTKGASPDRIGTNAGCALNSTVTAGEPIRFSPVNAALFVYWKQKGRTLTPTTPKNKPAATPKTSAPLL